MKIMHSAPLALALCLAVAASEAAVGTGGAPERIAASEISAISQPLTEGPVVIYLNSTGIEKLAELRDAAAISSKGRLGTSSDRVFAAVDGEGVSHRLSLLEGARGDFSQGDCTLSTMREDCLREVSASLRGRDNPRDEAITYPFSSVTRPYIISRDHSGRVPDKAKYFGDEVAFWLEHFKQDAENLKRVAL